MRYFRIITENPDIQKQLSMEKMSGGLHVKKMEHVGYIILNYLKDVFEEEQGQKLVLSDALAVQSQGL